jgi:DNA-binding NarL/FixJ family response regulator
VMRNIKIVIADDHKLFREGLKSLLAKEENFEVIGEATNGRELLDLLPEIRPDVVLIDLSMPEVSGLEVLQEAKTRLPHIKFIVLTMYDDGQYVAKSVRNGAFGYLLKNADEEELKTAVRQVVLQGKKYFNPHISELLINSMAIQQPRAQNLSEREQEVLYLVAQGKTTKDIAHELFVSTRTIETHRANIMKKLEVHNTAELIKKAMELKLIDS